MTKLYFRRVDGVTTNGISRKGMGRAKRNWCPDCKAYTVQNHNHEAEVIRAKLRQMEREGRTK